MKKTSVSIIVLTLCAVYSAIPLLTRSEFIFADDIGYHISRAQQVSFSIKEGILYPRWLPMSNGGYGSPTTIFYSPLFYLLTGVTNLFIPSLIVSLKVVTFVGFLFSGMAMYVFLRNFYGHLGSVAGGIAYQLLPYHIFNLYWRGVLAETFAFFWFPLILHFAYMGVIKNRLSYWIGMSLSYAGLILTHIASAYIFTFVMAVSFLFLSIMGKSFRMLMNSIFFSLFSLALSAVYFIPMFFERRFVHIKWFSEWTDYKHNFLFMAENSQRPIYINLEQIARIETLVVVFSLILIYYRSREYKDLPNSIFFAFFSWLFVFSLFISTPISVPIWGIVPDFPSILFPWRWLVISTFAAAALIGFSFDIISFRDMKRDRTLRIFTVLFHALAISNLYFSSFCMLTVEPLKKKDLNQVVQQWNEIEYRPIWLTQKTKDLYKEKWIPVSLKKGAGKFDIISWKSQTRLFTVNAAIPSTVRISTFYYPGWTALINGREVPIEIEKDSGAMLLNIPPGRSEVLLEFRDTPLRQIAKWISILSFFAALIGLIATRFKRQVIVT